MTRRESGEAARVSYLFPFQNFVALPPRLSCSRVHFPTELPATLAGKCVKSFMFCFLYLYFCIHELFEPIKNFKANVGFCDHILSILFVQALIIPCVSVTLN